MVGTIIPIVYGERLDGKRMTVLWLYAIGTIAGAGSFGALLGTVGSSLGLERQFLETRAIALTLGAGHLMLAHRDLGVIRFPLPQSRWQVPRAWLRMMPRPIAALAYGTALGVGVLTRINTSTFYAVLAWALLIGTPSLGAIVFAAFGLGRLMPVVALVATGRNDWDRTVRWVGLVDPWWPAAKLLNGLALAAVAGWLLAIAVAGR